MSLTRLLSLSLLLLCLAGCTPAPAPKPPAGAGTSGSASPVTASANAKSLQVLGTAPEFALVDQAGDAFGHVDLKGKVAVLNFIFTACPGTCPRQSERMAELHKRLQADPSRAGIRLISISVDPETDTPEVLRKYGERYEADFTMWKFLTGDRTAIWKMSQDGFHLPVAETPNDSLIPIAHDSKFVLIDRQGQIRGYFDALTESGYEQLLKSLNVVLPEFAPDIAPFPQLAKIGDTTHLAQPPEILESGWLTRAAAAEKTALENSSLRPSFQFRSARQESGITFHPQIVDDQRWRLLVNHYDHGNSVSAADVDGDGLSDLYFVSQVGPNELWRNLGGGKFENITQQAGVGLADRVCVAASFVDIDNDSDTDLYVTSVRGGNAMLLNDGTGKFVDISKDAGLEFSGHSSTGTFFDYDNDGLLDLFLTNVGKFTSEDFAEVRQDLCNSHPETSIKYWVGTKDAFAGHLKPELSEQSLLYRNLGGARFEDVSEGTGLQHRGWSGDALPLDVNADGWQDLYVLNMQGDDRLYVNQEGKTFVEQTAKYFPQTPWGAMGGKWFDYNNDGLFDLILTDMHSDMSEDVGPDREKLKSRMQWPEQFLQDGQNNIFGNAFYQQVNAGEFQEVSDAINTENYWPWGLSTGDLNADGYADVLLTSSMCFPYRYSTNSLLLNDQGKKFVDAQFSLGIEPRPAGEMLAPWFSLDADGEDANHEMCQGRHGTVVVWSARGSRSSVFLDLDTDGDLDIVTNEFNTPPQVLVSTLADQPGLNYITVKLQGTKSNRSGWGARVSVTAGGKTQHQVLDGKSGYLAQSVLPLYYGLGNAAAVEKVEVRWPTGQTQVLEGPLAVNQQHLIVEPAQ